MVNMMPIIGLVPMMVAIPVIVGGIIAMIPMITMVSIVGVIVIVIVTVAGIDRSHVVARIRNAAAIEAAAISIAVSAKPYRHMNACRCGLCSKRGESQSCCSRQSQEFCLEHFSTSFWTDAPQPDQHVPLIIDRMCVKAR